MYDLVIHLTVIVLLLAVYALAVKIRLLRREMVEVQAENDRALGRLDDLAATRMMLEQDLRDEKEKGCPLGLCVKCIFWLPMEFFDGTVGECRRHGPQRSEICTNGHYCKWPTTQQYDFCGDFVPGDSLAWLKAQPADGVPE